MTVESVLAHGLKTSVFGSQWNAEHGDNLALLDPDRIKSDLLANRPAAGAAHRFFFATDNQRLYYDTGAAWVEQSAAAHAAAHANGGADAVTLAQSQVTNLTADLAGKEPANANIQAHIASAANPHAVTKAQVGLGNADNTSDAAKPVSTAAQTALNGKAGITGNESIGGVKTFTSSVITSKGATLTPAAGALTIDSTGDYYTVAPGSFNNIATAGGSTATGLRTAAGIAREITLAFEGAGVITAAAALRLPGADASGTVYGPNITTYPGLVLRFREESAANWRCTGGIDSCPRFKTTKTGGNQNPSGGDVLDLVTWDAPSVNTNGTWASNTYTAVIPGDYDITATMFFNGLVANDQVSLAIYKNGASILQRYACTGTATSTSNDIDTTVTLAVGDIIKIFASLTGTRTTQAFYGLAASTADFQIIKKGLF